MATYIEIGNFLLWHLLIPAGVWGTFMSMAWILLLPFSFSARVALTALTSWCPRCRSWLRGSLSRCLALSWRTDLSRPRTGLMVTPLLNLCASLLLTTSFRSVENTGRCFVSLSSTLVWLPWSWPPAFSLLWFFRALGRRPRVHQSIESGLLRNGGATRRCAMC